MTNINTFLSAYESELKRAYAWTQDVAKLARFMESCTNTLKGENTWNHDGECVRAAWKACGQKGKPTKKALRAYCAS